MTSFFRLFAGLQSPRFRRRLKRRWVRYLSRLHDRTAILQAMHRID
jgi:hypothetical protein